MVISMFKRSVTNIEKLSRDQIKEFLNSFDTVLSDCDGVLWLGDKVIEKTPQVIKKFRELGKNIFYVTNNSTKHRGEYIEKFEKLNFSCTQSEIISTAYLVANYLKNLKFNKKVYLVGSKGITKELELVGIGHTEIGPDVVDAPISSIIATFELDPEVGAVVVGYDEHISYKKLLKAASYLNDPKCLFVASNTDERLAMDSKLVVPSTGPIVAAIESCAGRKSFVVGKPSSYISNVLKARNVDPKRTLMIGDRCNTDILLGTRCGFHTLLVLTGVTTLEEVNRWKISKKSEDQELVPDFCLQSLGDLLKFLS